MQNRIMSVLLLLCLCAALLPVGALAADSDAAAVGSEVVSGTYYEVYEEFPDLSVRNLPDAEAQLFDASATEYAGYEELKESIRSQMVEYAAGERDSIVVSITASSENAAYAPFQAAYYNALYDYPEELFFADTGFSYSYREEGRGVWEFELRPYTVSGLAEDAAAYHAAVDRACIACFGAADGTNSGMTDLEKIVAAHDWLAANCRYDPAVGNGGNSGRWRAPDGTVYRENGNVYTSYGVFVEHNAVCQGYALAFKVLMDRAGIDCCYSSSAGMGHGWNLVKLDGVWYHIDCTWDDPVVTGIYDYAGYVSRSNLLLGDSGITGTGHRGWSTEYDLTCPGDRTRPAALEDTGTTAAFYKNGAFYLSDDSGTLYRYSAGTDFASGTRVVSLGVSPRAAAFDYDAGTFYYARAGAPAGIDTYTLGSSSAVPFASLDGYDSIGVYVRQNDDGRTTLTATYAYSAVREWLLSEAKTYTVTLNANSGKIDGARTYKFTVRGGNTYGALQIPTRSGYTFAGWYTKKSGGTQVRASDIVTQNRTLYAHWTKNCTVTLNANGGKIDGKSTAKITVAPGAAYGELPTPSRTNYTFTGWYTKKSGGTQVRATDTVTKTQTIYAHWVKNYTVTLNANGGKIEGASTYKYTVPNGGAFGTLPNPVKSGYMFLGWYTKRTGGTQVRATDTVTKTQTLYAHWIRI